jgi:fatty-acid peroxygenase
LLLQSDPRSSTGSRFTSVCLFASHVSFVRFNPTPSWFRVRTRRRPFYSGVRWLGPRFAHDLRREVRDGAHRVGALPSGQRVMLDLYGTNRHPASWGAPEKFHPDRFKGREDKVYDFIPHGAADPHHASSPPLARR